MKRVEWVMAVDDNPGDLFLLDIALKRSKRYNQVELLESPDALLELLADGAAPSLVFVDLHMPAMSGFDLIEAIDALALTTPPRVFVLTSSTAQRDRDRAASSDLVEDYVLKPLSTDAAISLADRFGEESDL